MRYRDGGTLSLMKEDRDGLAASYLPLLGQLAEETGVKIYAVGGTVRDLLLGRPLHDIDLVIDGDVEATGRRWAERLGGKFIFLHAEPATVRVVLAGKGKNRFLICDLVELGEEEIEENLRGRDFTVNAMALPFNIFIATAGEFIADSKACVLRSVAENIVDPCGGLTDLQRRLIRPCRSDALAHDPLRALRALRLAGELGFSLVEETLVQIRQYAAGLKAVAGERVGEEMGKILNLSPCVPFLRLLLELDLPVALPSPLRLTALAAEGLSTVRRLEQFCASLMGVYDHFLRSYLLLPCFGNRGRLAVMKLAALFNALPEAEPWLSVTCRRWCWSRREEQLAQRLLTSFKMIKEALCPFSAWTEEEKTAALFRLWRQSGEEWLSFIIWAGAVCPGYGPDFNCRKDGCQRVINHLIEDWRGEQLPWQNVQPLLTAEKICKTFGLKPSPLLGRVVTDVLTAQVTGRIKSREEAEALAASIIQRYQKTRDQRLKDNR